MRKTAPLIITTLLSVSFTCISLPVTASSSPFLQNDIQGPHPPTLASLKIKDIQKVLGRKLTLKERIAVVILKKTRHRSARPGQEGNAAFIIALVSLGLFLLAFALPPLIIGTLVGCILAIVLGSVAKRRDPSDRKAYAAVLIGWITLGAFVFLSIIALLAWAAFWNSF